MLCQPNQPWQDLRDDLYAPSAGFPGAAFLFFSCHLSVNIPTLPQQNGAGGIFGQTLVYESVGGKSALGPDAKGAAACPNQDTRKSWRHRGRWGREPLASPSGLPEQEQRLLSDREIVRGALSVAKQGRNSTIYSPLPCPQKWIHRI